MRTFFFFFNDTATTEIYTLSLHDALPISAGRAGDRLPLGRTVPGGGDATPLADQPARSEEHTSELQSQSNLVCRLLLEKKKNAKCAPDHRLLPVHDRMSIRHKPSTAVYWS